MAFYRTRRIWNTALYQGHSQKRGYFEGWYFKNVSKTGDVYSIIPGVAMGKDGSRHAFIQTIDGSTAETHYVTFPYSEFTSSKRHFVTQIGDNTFSRDRMLLDITDGEFHLACDLSYTDLTLMPFSLINPNAMGWYSFVPFMECYHGLVSMDHAIHGVFTVNNRTINYDDGRGYIEKDWGISFPASWVWMQSNSFPNSGDSFMLSVANIPWLGKHFIGFLGFLNVSGTCYRFATYTGARITKMEINEHVVIVEISSRDLRFTIKGTKKRKGMLQAPINGIMERRIAESIDAEITITAETRSGEVLFHDTGLHGGLETVGESEELIEGIR